MKLILIIDEVEKCEVEIPEQDSILIEQVLINIEKAKMKFSYHSRLMDCKSYEIFKVYKSKMN